MTLKQLAEMLSDGRLYAYGRIAAEKANDGQNRFAQRGYMLAMRDVENEIVASMLMRNPKFNAGKFRKACESNTAAERNRKNAIREKEAKSMYPR